MPSSSSKSGYLLSFIYNLLIDNAKIKIILETTKKKGKKFGYGYDIATISPQQNWAIICLVTSDG